MEAARTLNFLFVSRDEYPPYRVDVAVLFGEEMVARGHRIEWILQSGSPAERAYRTVWRSCRVWVGAADYGKSAARRLRRVLLGIANDLRVLRLVRRGRYDFIQVKDKFVSALPALVAARATGTRFFYWLSYPFPEEDLLAVREGAARYPRYRLARGMVRKALLYRLLLPAAAHVFVQSEQMKSDVAAHGIPATKITPVPMGVRAVPSALPQSGEGPDGPPIVLYLGSLDRIRRLDFLLRAFRSVLARAPEARLHLVGGGSEPEDEAFLRAEARRLEIAEAVDFKGFVPMEEAWSHVRRAAVCVSPFHPTPILNSTSPTKMIEYMAMGKPVVANDHPEQQLVLGRSGGGLCVRYDEQSFADAILELLNDREKAAEMGRRGRFWVERYRTYKVIADRVEEVYLNACR
ncbi:MAG: glycosyltransferase family 4 protein [bacterium]